MANKTVNDYGIGSRVSFPAHGYVYTNLSIGAIEYDQEGRPALFHLYNKAGVYITPAQPEFVAWFNAEVRQHHLFEVGERVMTVSGYGPFTVTKLMDKSGCLLKLEDERGHVSYELDTHLIAAV